MNEIALANFYRVLNNEDRFPKEHELAEAAIAAKDELNALRSAPLANETAQEDGQVPFKCCLTGYTLPKGMRRCSVMCYPIDWGTEADAPKATMPAKGLEPRGCPTPGACVCPAPVSAIDCEGAAREIVSMFIAYGTGKVGEDIAKVAAIVRKHSGQREGWLAELREAMVPVFEAADFGSREQSPPGYWDADIDRVKAMLAAAPEVKL